MCTSPAVRHTHMCDDLKQTKNPLIDRKVNKIAFQSTVDHAWTQYADMHHHYTVCLQIIKCESTCLASHLCKSNIVSACCNHAHVSMQCWLPVQPGAQAVSIISWITQMGLPSLQLQSCSYLRLGVVGSHFTPETLTVLLSTSATSAYLLPPHLLDRTCDVHPDELYLFSAYGLQQSFAFNKPTT